MSAASYFLIVGEQAGLIVKVNKWLDDGWELHGPTVFARMSDAVRPFKPEPIYAQAMTNSMRPESLTGADRPEGEGNETPSTPDRGEPGSADSPVDQD